MIAEDLQARPGDVHLNSNLADVPVESDLQSKAVGRASHFHFGLLVRILLLLGAAVLLSLHYVHLKADFPNNSPWMDWAKYTDEGWYGDAAIRHLQLGHWYVAGDFNPAVALPVWPALEYLLFSVTGVSLVAARALSVTVFAAICLVGFLLVRHCSWPTSLVAGPEPRRLRWTNPGFAAECAVALLAASPFCYAFSRLAVLEPLLILLGLLGLLAAAFSGSAEGKTRALAKGGLGVLLPLIVLTKTTGLFLLPSILWMLFACSEYRVRVFFRKAVVVGAIGGALWAAYFLLLVRPHYLEDYRYLFHANGYTGMTRENAMDAIGETFHHGFWMGKLVYPAALLTVFAAFATWRRSFRNPLVPSLMLWVAGYTAFLAYHNNYQPRYYLVLVVPLLLLIPVVFESILQGFIGASALGAADRGVLITIAAVAFLTIFVVDARQMAGYVVRPSYTFVEAADGIRKRVLAERTHNPMILSISGSDLSLMTGLPSICDDFGTLALEDRAAKYRPGWFATWNEVDDDKMDALSPYFQMEQVAAFPAFDDPERNLLILYRLDPIADKPRSGHRKALPRLAERRVAQVPAGKTTH